MNEDNNYSKQKKTLAIIKFAVLLLIIVGIPAFLYLNYGAELFSKDSADRIIDYLTAHRRESALLIILIQMLQVIICILPGQPIQFASSYMFGIAIGFILSIIGAVIGSAIAFYLAKLLGKDMLYILFDRDKIEDYRNKLNSAKGLLIVMLIYLIPGVPKDLTAYAAGISDIKFKPFIIVSSIARSPAMLGSLLLGHFYGEGDYRAITILIIAVAIILIICILMRKKIMNYLDKLESIE